MINRIFLLLSRFIEKGVMFLFFAIMARHFGLQEFGEFSYYFSLATMMFVLFDNGGELYQMPMIAKHGFSRKLFFRMATIKTLFFIVVLLLTMRYIQNVKVLYLLLAFYLESLVSLGRSFLFYQGEFIRESIYHTAEKLTLFILALVAGLWMDHLILMYLSLAIGKIIYLSLLMARSNAADMPKSIPSIMSIIVGSWSYVFHAGLVAIALQLDVILMRQLGLSYDQIALYSAAIRIVMAVTVIPQVLFNYYYPDVARYINNGDHDSLKGVLKRARVIEWASAVVIMFTIALTSEEIVYLVYGDEFKNSAMVLLLLSPVILFRFTKYADSAVLSASSRNKLKLYVSVLAVTVGIVLNIFLIPKYDIFGPIVSVFVSELILWIGFRLSALKISDVVNPIGHDIMMIVAIILILLPIVFGMQDLQFERIVLVVSLWLGVAIWFVNRWAGLNRIYK